MFNLLPNYAFKQLCCICLLIVCPFITSWAQQKNINGTIKDENGQGIPGASVVIKGTQTGSISDLDGKYSINVPEDKNTLVFSFIGFLKSEIEIGSSNTIDVTMKEETKLLGEVVVTALNFEEDPDNLAATSSKITSESVVKSGEASLISGMAGKASGLQISAQGADPGAGALIQIRGQSTITGNTQPLIILDGVPISNSIEGAGGGGVVQQSRLNDINPNDIASIQVLKGASAAALWGSRAANGVIVINTKSGKKGDKINIGISSTLSFDRVNTFHTGQNNFGQGINGNYSPTHPNSWGDKIADRSGAADVLDESGHFFEARDGTRYYPILQKNTQNTFVDHNFNQVYGTGTFMDNAINISSGDDKSAYYFSVGDLNQNGMMRGNNDYRRTTLRLNTSREFNDIVKITNRTGYTRSFSNRVGRGNNTSGAQLGLLRTPPDFNNEHYIGSYYEGPNATPIENRQRSYRRYLGNSPIPIFNNPLWTMYEPENTSLVHRFINSFDLEIKPVNWFTFNTRLGIDNYSDERKTYFPISDSAGSGEGYYSESITNESEVNLDLIGRVVKDISPAISTSLIVGFNVNDRKFVSTGGSMRSFLIPNSPPNFSNAIEENRTPENYTRNVRVARVYSNLNMSVRDALFINVSLAGESASTFGEMSDKTFYYPSSDIAWQFSQLGAISNSSFLNFGKLRASYGVVGVQPLPYRSNTTFAATSFSNSPWGDNINGSQFGNGAYLIDTELGDAELRPERKTEYEVGTDMRFLNNKLRTSITYYANTVEDLLIPVSLAPSVGFSSTYTNAATLENKGWEIDLGIDVISKGDIKWSLNGNFNRNRNTVSNLAGTESLILAGRADRADMRAVEGYQAGVFWGGRFERDEAGALVLNENNFPMAAPTSGVIGDPNPDWRGGFGTTLTYRKLTLDVLFETFQGGDFFGLTRGVMYTFGTHEDVGNEVVLDQTLTNYAGESFPAGSTVRGNIYDFGGGPVLLDQSYYTSLGSGLGSAPEQFIEDGSWTRLRAISLSYLINSAGFKNRTKFQSAEISVTGRNLFLWTDVSGIDPDTNYSGNIFARGYDYFNSPGSRSFLFSIKLNY
ncbi:SusC/RagA family TonB-linked outer membrane protein [Cyclobacterium plantarum]|uniref:SusC/RagA family TonB-linked outer membrane protein n=1 Tax=Cyclobacterium plantarum TaxID=2716263 RepID=UPI003F71A804